MGDYEDWWTWKRYAQYLTHEPLVRGDHEEGAVQSTDYRLI